MGAVIIHSLATRYQGKKNRPARGRAIKPNGAKLYVTVFGGREFEDLKLNPESKQNLYLNFGRF